MPKGLRPKFIKMARKAGAKNIFAYAWTLQKRMRGSRSPRVTKRGGSMGKGKYRRRGKSLYRSMLTLAKAGALIAPALIRGAEAGPWDLKLRRVVESYTGIHAHTGNWEPALMIKGWGPYVGVCLGEKVLSWVNRILRRL